MSVCLTTRILIELDKTKVDAWGIPVLRITCVWRENELQALLKDMSITAAEMLSAAGARDIEPSSMGTTLPD